jgi:hypothetical protein
MIDITKLSVAIALTTALVACGGGGGSTSSTSNAPSINAALTQVATSQNVDQTSQIFNTQAADLNGDGLEDVVVSGWAVEPSGSTLSPHGRVPIKILIQQTDGTLQDQTNALLGSGNNMIWGSQRIVIADFDNDAKPDIFLGGFQDSPSQGNHACCSPTTSVMFWNNGTSFSRYDFTDAVWAHAVCVDDLYGNGRLDIVTSGTGTNASDVYVNNGNRSFTMMHLPQFIGGGGQCSVVHDATTGNVGIVTTDIGYSLVAGYTAVLHTFDHNMNFIGTTGLPGSQGAIGSHDIVNIVQMDLNNDGVKDLILTDNFDDNNDGRFIALINKGNLVFSDQTSTYFPNQANNLYFQYYTRTLTSRGSTLLFASTVNAQWSFSALPSLWVFNGTFTPYQQSQMSADVGPYQFPTVYQTATGSLNVLLIQAGPNGQYTFYTKPL